MKELLQDINQYTKLLEMIPISQGINSTILAKKFGMSYPMVCTKVRFLEKIGLVKVTRLGRDNLVITTQKGELLVSWYSKFKEDVKNLTSENI